MENTTRTPHLDSRLERARTHFANPSPYLTGNYYISLRARIVKQLLGEISNCRILDLGCGDGTISLQFLAANNHITLVDSSDGMLERAKLNTPSESVTHVDCLCWDIFEFDPDARFDVVLCIGWKATLLRPMETWAACRLDTVWVLSDDDRDGLQAAAPRATVRRLPGFGVGCDLAKFAPSAQPSAPRLARNSESRASMLHSRFSVASLISKGSPASPARSWRFLRRTRARGCCSSARAIGSTLPGSARRKSARSKPRRKSSTSVFAPDVERCLPAADVLLFPSRREGLPVCAMEALALGVPVITCDARGCREVVRDGVDGLVLRDGRLATLRAAMQAVLDDEGLCRRGRFIAEQIRIYKNLFRPARTGALTAVAAC
jgi:Glycosyl transferases group 1/Methyltransferase domain